MSERKSISFPNACSGDIYAGVPIKLPGMVGALAPLSNDLEDRPDGAGAIATVSVSSAGVRTFDNPGSCVMSITAVSNSSPGIMVLMGRGMTVFGPIASGTSCERGVAKMNLLGEWAPRSQEVPGNDRLRPDRLRHLLRARSPLAQQIHLGHSEVEHFHRVSAAAVWFQPDVVGLQIAMDDAMPMCLRKRQSDLVQKVCDQRQRDPRIGFLEIRKRLSVEKLHHQVGHVAASGFRDSEIRDIDDVQMAQAAACLCFALETGEKLRFRRPPRSDHFDRDDTRRSEMRCQVDITHSARAELPVDAVFGVEDFADHGVIQGVQPPS